MKIRFMMPTYETPCRSTVRNLVDLREITPDRIHFGTPKAWIPVQRDDMIDALLEDDDTHVAWCDSDISGWSYGLIEHLVGLGKDVVGVAYAVNGESKINAGIVNNWEKEYLPSSTRSLVKVDFVALGFAVVNVDVYRELGSDYHQLPDDVPTKRISEDHSFCIRAKRAGFEIWCEASTAVVHNWESGHLPEGFSKGLEPIQHKREK